MIRLSQRLTMSAKLVTAGGRVADVGCDHAHTGIRLIQSGIARSYIGMDVRPGPLGKAQENIARCFPVGSENRIELRLSDGLEALEPGEADSIVIAGMGGILTTRILSDGLQTALAAKELILQPQSHISEVRGFLEREGFTIVDEDMCFEDGKYYTAMKAVPGRRSGPMSAAEKEFGPVLLERRHPVLHTYLEHMLAKYERRLGETGKGVTGDAEERSGYFETMLDLVRQSLLLFTIGG